MERPRIAIFSLGGTIAMVPTTVPGSQGVVPGLNARDLLDAVPDLEHIARVEAESFLQVASAELRLADIARLAQRIREAFAGGFEGAVITQGTDTLEETAFQLDLLLEAGCPVVVTGALRNPTLAGADGPANLLGAVRVAASPAAEGLGVLVVANDEIHAARFVRKTHTYKTSAFSSPAAGPLGWIVEDRVRIVMRPMSPSPLLTWKREPPLVPVVLIGMAMEPAVIEAIADLKPAGIVVAALGAGHVPPAIAKTLGKLAAHIPVVLASRIGTGEMCRHTYAYAGSEIDLLGRNLVPGGYLDPAKARILLSLLLAEGADRRRIEETFACC